MNLEQALKKLYSLHQFGVKLGLEKPKKLFEFIGNPQKDLQCIHIAGSNAKGSVASFISSILIEDGFKVGLYTSPHFVKFNERIRINGVMIEDEYIAKFMNEMNEYIDVNEPTFFELTTAMAFKYFKEKKVDFAVIETGLGGRLDATNVIDPIVSVITTISLEHTNILGTKLEQIAYEKGEIIKKNRKAVIGLLPPEAERVIEKKASSVQAELSKLNDFLLIEKDHVRLNLSSNQINIYRTPLFGFYQLKNAALAVLTIDKSIKLRDPNSILRGIDRVLQNSGLQGRYEIYHDYPRVIFDSSHNEEGIINFISEVKNELHKYEKKEIIFGVLKDKDIRKMLVQFDKHFDKIYATTFDYERAASIEQITEIAEEIGIKTEPILEPHLYVRNFIRESQNKCLIILGSIYLLGNIKTKLLNEIT
jgi:dihydrofolate synthase/folylpolyglutamate synthase